MPLPWCATWGSASVDRRLWLESRGFPPSLAPTRHAAPPDRLLPVLAARDVAVVVRAAARLRVGRPDARRAATAFAAVVGWLFACLAVPSGALAADAFPDWPIHLIVALPAGSRNDILTRSLAQGMRSVLGQAIVVEKRAGADGIVATRRVVAAAPDGYTLLSALGSQLVKSIGLVTK